MTAGNVNLNTDGGEGLANLTNSAASDLGETWVQRATQCQTSEELKAVWSEGLMAIKAAKDMAAYSQFKAFVEKRGEHLKANAQPVIEGEIVEGEDQ